MFLSDFFLALQGLEGPNRQKATPSHLTSSAIRKSAPSPLEQTTALHWLCFTFQWWGHLLRRSKTNLSLLPLGQRWKKGHFCFSRVKKPQPYYCDLWHVLEDGVCPWTESELFLGQSKVCLWVRKWEDAWLWSGERGCQYWRVLGYFQEAFHVPCWLFFLLLYLNFSFNWRTVTLPLLTFFNKIEAPRPSSRCNKTDMVRPLCFKYAFTKKKKYAFTTYIMKMPANM